jgi:serine protease inhibitor
MQRSVAAARLTCMGNKLRITAGAAGAAALLLAGCGAAPAARPQPPAVSHGAAGNDSMADSAVASPRAYGTADTAFGLDLLGAWCRAEPSANIVFSPESLASGLGMAYLGAGGSTAHAMAGVLHLPSSGAALEAGLHARSAALRELDGPGVTVAGSDRVWASPTLKPRASYLNAVADGYGARLAEAPLLTDPARATAQINAAIAATTRGHIPHLLSPGSLKGIGWVLTDALYLDADWAAPFPASQTKPGSFTTATGQQVTARFLHGGAFRYTDSGGWTAVSLPYRGGKLTMTALLPDSGARGCPALSAATLGAITTTLAAHGRHLVPGSSGTTGTTDIALPKVSLSSSASMQNLLTSLGMGVAFSQAADFTRLSAQACCIGKVVHAATLSVGEKGTVGSAATAVGLTPTAVSVPLQRLTFDRPYLLLVTATGTGEPLFLARVANPV